MLFIVSAPSGAGKTTLCKELSRVMPTLAHSISHTTRKPRPGEVEGEHYYFVTGDEFRRIADGGGFAESATVHGNLYGTSKAELKRLFDQGKDIILDIDTQGAMKIKRSGLPGVFIFILPPSMEELEKRLRGRESDDEDEIKKRLKRATGEIRSYKEYDYVIVNNDFTEALVALGSVVVAEKNRTEKADLGWLKEKFGI
jgi:guanylate kinase